MIRSYDLESPKKFTRERMNAVESLCDSFARALAPYLTGLLQSFCEININGTVEKRYRELSSSVQDHSFFGMTTMGPTNKDYDEVPLTMEVDTRLAFFMIERLLGGVELEYGLSRDFTDIERAILQHVLKKITEFLGEAWGQYLDIEVSLTGFQTSPHLLQMSAREDVVIQVELEVVIEKLGTRTNMVTPAPNVEEFISKFGCSFAVGRKKQGEDKQKSKRYYIERHLLESEVELRTIFREFTLDAQDILQLAPRNVIPLDKEADNAISFYMEDAACFEARAGQTKIRKAVKISRGLQPGGEDMLSMGKKAIKELTEMETVPICNILGSLLDKSVEMSVSKVEETDMGSLIEDLPHFDVAIESRKAVGGMSTDQLYIFAKEDMIRLTNCIMGVPVDAQSPLDEVTPSTLKEVVSQCMSAAMDEFSDFLGKNMRDITTRISASDNTERIQDTIRSWNAEDSVLLMELHCVIDGVVESDAHIVAAQTLGQMLGISDMADIPCQETGGQTPGIPAVGMQTAEHKGAIAVQEVSFPRFKHTPIVYAKERTGEEKKKLLDIALDVSIRFGSTVCSVRDMPSLKEGQLLVLGKQAGLSANVVVSGELVGREDVLVTGDQFGARIIEAVDKRE